MSVNSLRKVKLVDIDDSIEDLRAAFICVTNNANGHLKSSKELSKGKIFYTNLSKMDW